ncbi:MAG: HAD family hydrolase [Gemmatimonadota bacterium]|jgi:phosphoglycolate phosphatase-like HAD superfamily hydrolase
MRRLILFDIDGTLLAGGPAKEAFEVALVDVFGTTGAIDVHEFSGKTDPQIARELLTAAGLSDAEVDTGLPGLWKRYREELEARLPGRPMEVLAGVEELLDALDASGEAALGLVTGNILDGARLKLGSAGLLHRFEVGGYGSDDESRNHLPGIAVERARRRFGRDFPVADVVIVGDTPRDVECGRHEGCVTVAVATGNFDVGALERSGADRVVEDLAGTEALVGFLLDGVRP